SASVTLPALALIYRPLVLECLDPSFLRAERGRGSLVHMLFLLLLVMTLVSGFQVLGTLMVVGIMMLPATAARFWARTAGRQMVLAAVLGSVSGYAGLLISFYIDAPASSAIILSAGCIYVFSLLAGPYGGLFQAARQAYAGRRRLPQTLAP